MIKVFVATPTTGSIVDGQGYVLRAMADRYKDQIMFIYPEACVRRIFHDFARNGQVEEFLKTDCDVIWFLDSDITPPYDLWDEYLKSYEEWDAAGAPYPVFMTQPSSDMPIIVMAVYNGRGDKGGLRPSEVPQMGTGMVDGIATGCIMIKRHIFEKIAQPWFKFSYDEKTRMMIEGEDIRFCKLVGDLGYKFFVDYSKVCRHRKDVCLLDVNNYAMAYANQRVIEYDAMIRPKIDELVTKIKTLTAKKEQPVLVTPTYNKQNKLILPADFK